MTYCHLTLCKFFIILMFQKLKNINDFKYTEKDYKMAHYLHFIMNNDKLNSLNIEAL